MTNFRMSNDQWGFIRHSSLGFSHSSNMTQARELGKILIEQGKITQDKLDLALIRQKRTRQKLGDILVALQLVSEEDVARALVEQLPGWEYFDRPMSVDLSLLEKLGQEFCRKHRILPVYLDTAQKDTGFVFADPYDTRLTDLLKEKGLGSRLEKEKYFLSTASGISSCLARAEEATQGLDFVEHKAKEIAQKGFAYANLAEDFIDLLMKEAVNRGATDIHIEPAPETTDIRFRIDGILYPVVSLLREHHNNLVNVLFNRAGLNPEDFNVPHDKRITWTPREGKPVDIRLSAIPARHSGVTAAGVCLRIFDTAKKTWPLNSLGYCAEHIDAIKKIIRKPQGMVLVTGPTGSGKTTTLYTLLSMIKSVRVKIITVEDPVEMEMPMVQQQQVEEATDFNFSRALRSMLRHDPDVILIGEIRDAETAQEAIRAAITGHLVFSTLHTSSAAGSILRLVDLGVSPEYIISSVTCLIAQRLVRKLCPECRRPLRPDMLDEPYRGLIEKSQWFQGKPTLFVSGRCAHCVDGYRGRTVAAELLLLKPGLFPYIINPDPVKLAQEATRLYGFRTMEEDGLRLVASGVTSFEEIERVVGLEV